MKITQLELFPKMKKTSKKNENLHAKYSPSMLEHLEVCPGYEKESGDNAFSLEGTLLHKACQTGRLAGLDTEQASVVRQCLDYVDGLKRKDTKADKREIKLDVAGYTWGTADRLLVHGDNSADLVDFKFGRNSVDDAETNLQGWCYARGVFHQFPKILEVRVHFLLPRRDEISTATFTRDMVPDIDLRITAVIERRKYFEASKLEGMLNPRPVNCLYCGAKATCQNLHEIAFRIAKKYDETFDIPEEVHSSQIQDPREMAKAKAIAVVMKSWAGSVDEHALQMVLNGTELPGWEMASRQGKLKIQDAMAAFSAVKAMIPEVSLEEFVAYVSVTKTGLEEMVTARAQHGEKASSVRTLNENLIEMGVGTRDPDTNYLRRIKE